MRDGFKEMAAEAQRFFADLERNNSRDWFEPRKDEYKERVQRPAEMLCELFADEISRLTGQGHSGKVNRIYRDVRFSKDKSPYKIHLSMVWQAGASPEHGWLLSVAPSGIALMTGLHTLEGPSLTGYRAYVDRHGDRLQAAIDDACSAGASMTGWGDYKLKRVPKPFDSEHPHAELLRHKQLVVSVPLDLSKMDDGLLAAMTKTADACLPFWKACQAMLRTVPVGLTAHDKRR
jgi:uncharacterized protein (TIGR02453 family)